MANREALAMVQSLRSEIRDVIDWQKNVLARVETLCPAPVAHDVTVLDFDPETITALDAGAFRYFIEASVSKLSRAVE